MRRNELAAGIALASVVAAISMVLTMQGWRSQSTAFDLLTYVYSADRFIEAGTLPLHGDTGSYGSYKPPGTAWLMMPSRLLTSEPRLANYGGTALLHVAALVSIFLLGRRYFGFAAAAFAVILYGISSHGIFLAGSLWPNGRPDFFVLTVALSSAWVTRSDARFLAAALLVWAIGMYVDMGLAPAAFIFPVLWFYYRPPVKILSLAVAGVIAILIWSPYLTLELGRGFADIRSQLLLQNIFPADYRAAYCDPGRELSSVASVLVHPDEAAGASGAAPSTSNSLGSVMPLAATLVEKSVSNFVGAAAIPAGWLVLTFACVASVLLFSVSGADSVSIHRRLGASKRRIAVLGLALVATGLVLHFAPLGSPTQEPLTTVPFNKRVGFALAFIGVAAALVPAVVAIVGRFLADRGALLQSGDNADRRKLLVLSLLVPWIVLVAVAEPGKAERFWWLWPLQLIFVAALAVNLLPRLVPRWLSAVAIGVTFILIAINPVTLSRISSWASDGWAGRDAPEVEIADFIAADVMSHGETSAAIGYQIFIYPFMATYHVTNPVYKAGAPFDLYLHYLHGINNTNQCAEGLSPFDEYRVVQTVPKRTSDAPSHYFPQQLDDSFRLLHEFEYYQVWARVS